MKQICMFLSILVIVNFLTLPMIISLESTQPMKLNFMNLPDQNIYWQGWVKYFHYNNNTRFQRPKSFYQNNDFFHQRIPNYLYDEKDNYGPMRIPSKHNFFLVLNNDSLSIYSTRYTIYKKSYDSLRIDNINLVPEDKPLKGGIKDLGNFDEGNCIELKVTIPKYYRNNFNPINNFNGFFQTWIICNNNEISKQKLLTTLLELKLKSQRNHGAVLTVDSIKRKKKGRKANISFGKKNPIRGKPVNGYWILLQNWTECTLKCGGGKSYQQWLCVPPKNGGRRCRGFSVKVRSCNTQKCPSHSRVMKNHLMRMKKAEENAAARMIIKVAPFSTRPERYSKCIIKENDAFLSSYNPQTRVYSKQPVRIVMNNQTVALYSDDEYENKIYTFDIYSTSISRTDQFCCFNLRDSMRSSKLCGFAANCGTRLNNKWVEDWLKDYNMFRTDCRTRKQISDSRLNYGGYRGRGKKRGDGIGEIFDHTLTKSSYSAAISVQEQPDSPIKMPGAPIKRPKNEIQRKAAKFKRKFTRDLQAKIIDKRENKIMRKVKKANRKVARGKVAKTENMGLAVMGKEMELEKLIKNEEKKREGKQMKKLLKIMKREKKKANCLKKSIRKRELDTQILKEKREAEKEVDHVKDEIKMEVEMKRNEMKRQIAQMRKKSRRRRAALESKINMIRTKMARRIMESNRCGDIRFCIKGKKSPSHRDNYCNTNFIDDYLKNYDCKTEESFCYMCCENEFGFNFLDKRDECYDICDGKELKKSSFKKSMKKSSVSSSRTTIDEISSTVLKKNGINVPPKKKQGGWVWVPWSKKGKRGF